MIVASSNPVVVRVARSRKMLAPDCKQCCVNGRRELPHAADLFWPVTMWGPKNDSKVGL